MGESKSYYNFFECLCDNSWRNIVYIGDDMKIGVSEDIINKVDTDYVLRDKELLCEFFGKDLARLEKRNESIRGKLLVKKGNGNINKMNNTD